MIKETLLTMLLCGSLSSCVTFRIPEEQVFKNSKYQVDEYSSYLDSSNLENQDKSELKKIINDLAYTNDIKIAEDNDMLLNRRYIQVNDSIKLEYIEFEPKSYSKSGMFFLGTGANVLNTYKELRKLAVETQSKIYVLNYRGYGNSEGVPSFKTVFQDNNAFFRTISNTDQNIDFVIGYSLGTIFATYFAVDNKINNLVLLAPFSDVEAMIASIKKQIKGFMSIAKPFIKLTAEDHLLDLSNSEKIGSYNGNLIISHAMDDNILPFGMGASLYIDCPSRKKELIEIEQGGHRAPFDTIYWEQIIVKLKGIIH